MELLLHSQQGPAQCQNGKLILAESRLGARCVHVGVSGPQQNLQVPTAPPGLRSDLGGLLLSGRLLIPKSAGADTCQAAGPPLLCTRICQNEWFLSNTQIAVSLKVTLPVSVSLLVWYC